MVTGSVVGARPGRARGSEAQDSTGHVKLDSVD
jgi:hypothetical protein